MKHIFLSSTFRTKIYKLFNWWKFFLKDYKDNEFEVGDDIGSDEKIKKKNSSQEDLPKYHFAFYQPYVDINDVIKLEFGLSSFWS